jgi:transposase
MIAFPAGVKVWIAGGVTDMRCGMNSLALKVQQGLGRDPHGGEIFCFRGRKGAHLSSRLHDDAIKPARIRGEPFLHLALSDLIGPHARD